MPKRQKRFPNFRAPQPCPAVLNAPDARRPRFDMSSPLVAAGVEKHYSYLSRRTVGKVEILHYLETLDGRWMCLDFDITSDHLDDLDKLVSTFLIDTLDLSLPSVSSRDLWMRMIRALPCDPPYRVLTVYGSPRTRYLVAQCTERLV